MTQYKTLYDPISGKFKINERKKQDFTDATNKETKKTLEPNTDRIDMRVVEVYRTVGDFLRRFTTGPLPKAFKVIPTLTDWEDILYLTEPGNWTPHAVYQATCLFSSNLNKKLTQRFLFLVLLPRIRNDIRENKRLHFILFQSLKKALYKPGAFYKGLLLPLCESHTCTLREATILSSLLRKASIPAVHSVSALLSLIKMQFCGTTCFFIQVLLEKGYPLHSSVVDAIASHFICLRNTSYKLPVLWHQSLLTFVHRYNLIINIKDREMLQELTKSQYHHQLSPEIQRLLETSTTQNILHVV